MNSNITRTLASGKLSTNKMTGAIIWLVGAWLTANALLQLGVPAPFHVAFGLAIQWALTRAESPLWRGAGYPKMALGACVVDVGVNAAGSWTYLKNLGATDFWQMVRDISGHPQSQPHIVTIIVLVLVVGAFVAAAAEYFWHLPD